MFFQRKKNLLQKRLWGFRVNTTPSPEEFTQQQQHHHHHHNQQQQQHYHYSQHQQQQQNLLHKTNGHRNQMITTSSPTTMDIDHQETTSSSFLVNCCSRGGSDGENNSGITPINNSRTTLQDNLYPLFCQLTKKLKESQIDTLLRAVEQGGTIDVPDCVLVPRVSIKGEEPHLLACRIWNWSDITNSSELKRLPSCPNGLDPIYVCCNPRHWMRIMPELPPPPYDEVEEDTRILEDRSRSEENLKKSQGSLPTDAEGSCPGWCNLAYWELKQRVGDQFSVLTPTINVFSEQIHGDGMCLTDTAQQRKTAPTENVLKARKKIGLGVTLCWEPDGMWLYNRSIIPVFVHSPTIYSQDSKFVVNRVSPGYCIRAFERHKTNQENCADVVGRGTNYTGRNKYNEPIDRYCVRISFGKGFGPQYSRQEVTLCPCWLEVLIRER